MGSDATDGLGAQRENRGGPAPRERTQAGDHPLVALADRRGRTWYVRTLLPGDTDTLAAYFALLSAEDYANFHPHPLDRATAGRLTAEVPSGQEYRCPAPRRADGRQAGKGSRSCSTYLRVVGRPPHGKERSMNASSNTVTLSGVSAVWTVDSNTVPGLASTSLRAARQRLESR